MSARELIVVLWSTEIGRLACDRQGRFRFVYAGTWRERRDAVPLSLSMPLAASEHPHRIVSAYLQGLLPDNEVVLRRWAQRFHVSARNPFALIEHVGEDCAGAVQFVRPERLDAVLGGGGMQVDWLDPAEIAARLRLLREDQGAWRIPSDTGQFSLAGAQAKTALLVRDGRFGVPTGRTPTTHILKPPLPHLPGHVENEHLCLSLAREVGLIAARSEVRRFGDEVAIVVTRYDRVETAALAVAAEARGAATEARALRKAARSQPIQRLHQEDLCQALGVPPASKYQNEGGPTPVAVAALLRDHSSRPRDDIGAFVGALAFNWLIAGTDAHAKNYSLLLAAGGQVRLAPLYDLASVLPYTDADLRRVRLAMKIGSTYLLRDIRVHHWRALCRSLGIDEDATIASLAAMAEEIVGRVDDLGRGMIGDGLDPKIVRRLVRLIRDRARACREVVACGA